MHFINYFGIYSILYSLYFNCIVLYLLFNALSNFCIVYFLTSLSNKLELLMK